MTPEAAFDYIHAKLWPLLLGAGVSLERPDASQPATERAVVYRLGFEALRFSYDVAGRYLALEYDGSEGRAPVPIWFDLLLVDVPEAGVADTWLTEVGDEIAAEVEVWVGQMLDAERLRGRTPSPAAEQPVAAVEDGALSVLEAYAYASEDWPAESEPYSMFYTTRGRAVGSGFEVERATTRDLARLAEEYAAAANRSAAG